MRSSARSMTWEPPSKPFPMKGSKAGTSLGSEWVLIAFSTNSTQIKGEFSSTTLATDARSTNEVDRELVARSDAERAALAPTAPRDFLIELLDGHA